MNLDFSRFLIGNIHRLCKWGTGPRPVIIKFVSKIDRDLVWSRKHLLTRNNISVYIREHFAEEIENNIKTLLPIRKAALNQKMKVTMIEDHLIINSKTFTVNNLHELPITLQHETMSTRIEENYVFFFSAACTFSNFHPSQLSIDEMQFPYNEQYIQHAKALLFKDTIMASKILKAKKLKYHEKAWRKCKKN